MFLFSFWKYLPISRLTYTCTFLFFAVSVTCSIVPKFYIISYCKLLCTFCVHYKRGKVGLLYWKLHIVSRICVWLDLFIFMCLNTAHLHSSLSSMFKMNCDISPFWIDLLQNMLYAGNPKFQDSTNKHFHYVICGNLCFNFDKNIVIVWGIELLYMFFVVFKYWSHKVQTV